MATDWRVQFKRAQKGGGGEGAASPPSYAPGEAPWDEHTEPPGHAPAGGAPVPACWGDGETLSREGAQGKVCGRCAHRDSCDESNQGASVSAMPAATHTSSGSSRGYRPAAPAPRAAVPAVVAPREERPECFGWEDAYDITRYGCAVCPSRVGCAAAISDLQAKRTAKVLEQQMTRPVAPATRHAEQLPPVDTSWGDWDALPVPAATAAAPVAVHQPQPPVHRPAAPAPVPPYQPPVYQPPVPVPPYQPSAAAMDWWKTLSATAPVPTPAPTPAPPAPDWGIYAPPAYTPPGPGAAPAPGTGQVGAYAWLTFPAEAPPAPAPPAHPPHGGYAPPGWTPPPAEAGLAFDNVGWKGFGHTLVRNAGVGAATVVAQEIANAFGGIPRIGYPNPFDKRRR